MTFFQDEDCSGPSLLVPQSSSVAFCSTNFTTGQTIGIKSFTNYTNSNGIWNSGASTLIAVGDEVTERTTGTASVITVSFVNGTSAGAYIAVACTNYNNANAKAMFELEAICTLPDTIVTGGEVIVQPA